MQPGDVEERDGLVNGPARRRGAGLNPGNRFEKVRLHVLGEERERQRVEMIEAGIDADGAVANVPVEVTPDPPVHVINRVPPPSDVPFDWPLNPSRGCEPGCIYCSPRPYHEYLGYSCGLDFETKIVAKFD